MVTQVHELSIDTINCSNNVRVNGENLDHVNVLAQVEIELPPILVHRKTMRVIDGMHRLRAAAARGDTTIMVQLFDGDENEAFIRGVEANIAHGMPLTLADRKVATRRIIAMYPQWSDRRIAAVTGLSHKTVGTVRRLSTGEIPQLDARIGLDGRVRNVRERANEGPDEPPVGEQPATPDSPADAGTGLDMQRSNRDRAANDRILDRPTVVRNLRADPSLRFTEAGRALLRWLDACPNSPLEIEELVKRVPDHCVNLIIAFALKNSEDWQSFAAELGRRERFKSLGAFG